MAERSELLRALTEADEDASIVMVIQGRANGSFLIMRSENLVAGAAKGVWDGVHDHLTEIRAGQ